MESSSIRAALLAAFLAMSPGPTSSAEAPPTDQAALLEGVTRIAAPGVPGPLCVFGEQAFPVVVGGLGGPVRGAVVAVARLGAGRIVAFGHPGFFDEGTLKTADTGRLMVNAVRWAAGTDPAKGNPRVAVHRCGGVLACLKNRGLNADALDGADWHQRLGGFRALCINPNSLHADAQFAAVERFVREGGGLVLADLGWGWLQLHPGHNLLEHHPGNRLLAPAGLVWADGYLQRTADVGFDATVALSPLTHAAHALDALLAHETGKARLKREDIAQAVCTVSHATRSVPPGDALLLPRLRTLRQDASLAALPTPQKPLTMDKPLARVLLTMELREFASTPPDKLRAHPAAAAFPGAVPAEAERVTRTVSLDTRIPAWQSTGLYAAPGEVVTVEVPKEAVGKGLFVRIGCHNDILWDLDAWWRCPEVCRRFPIEATSTPAANAFGGLVYIEVPGACTLGTIPVTLRGAISAPFYVSNSTDLKEWVAKTRHQPAPWAELATRKVVLTLPSDAVRKLDDPEGLMRFWDQVLDACAELAGLPLDRERPERYVADTQIAAGYMHSGYPIMLQMDMPPVMVDKACLIREGHGGVWGLFHELGHNHQSGDWTFDGTGEVTVNLFTLYVFDKACGTPPSKHPRVSGKAREDTIKRYLATGPDFSRWKSDPFIALMMYVQMQEAFGWDAFRKVFAEYRQLPPAERPKSDDAKRDQWLVRFSKAAGRNLGPFFQAWGVPTSDATRASVSTLPAWMPAGFPPK